MGRPLAIDKLGLSESYPMRVVRSQYGKSKKMLTSGRRRTRRGMTIIELLMLMSILAFVFGAAIVQMQLLMRLGHDGRARLDRAFAWERLGRQFRQDVHDATSAKPFDAGKDPSLRIESEGKPSTVIEYRFGKAEVVRTEAASGKKVASEAYALTGLIEARFEERVDSKQPFIVLVSKRKIAKVNDIPPRIEEIIAALRPPGNTENTSRKEATP